MDKVLLLSTIYMLVIIPVLASKERNYRLAVRKALFWLVAYNFFYLFALRFIYPRLL